MDVKTNIKKRLPSRHVTEGPERAPHRSYLYAMGLTTEQIHQPFVGVASCWNEAAPCNISLMRQAQAVKKGVASAGGTPREFCTITVTDGIAMGHDGMRSSLPSRECIADSVELTIRGHAYDGLVGLAGCDKSLPGMMMAMVRLNVPSIFIYGGSILPGNFRGQQVTVQDMFEAVGKHSVGAMSDEDLEIGVDGTILDVIFLFGDLFLEQFAELGPLQFFDGLIEDLLVHLESDLDHESALFAAKQIAGAPDIEVSHGDLETAAKIAVLFKGLKPLTRICRKGGKGTSITNTRATAIKGIIQSSELALLMGAGLGGAVWAPSVPKGSHFKFSSSHDGVNLNLTWRH